LSRRDPTPEELAVGKALLASIDDGTYKIADFEFSDRPDLRLRANGHPQGYEVVGLLPGHIHQTIKEFSMWLYRKKVSTCKVIIPIEPHMWIKNVIENKWAKVQKYPATEFTTDLTLLIHPPRLINNVIDYDDDGFIRALDLGEACSRHGFAGIGYWSGKRFLRLGTQQRKADHTKLVWDDLSEGYPAYGFVTHTGTDLREELAGKPLSFEDVPMKHTKSLKPLSPQFQGLKPRLPPPHLKYEIGFGTEPKD
jgi:hypothetical protein